MLFVGGGVGGGGRGGGDWDCGERLGELWGGGGGGGVECGWWGWRGLVECGVGCGELWWVKEGFCVFWILLY